MHPHKMVRGRRGVQATTGEEILAPAHREGEEAHMIDRDLDRMMDREVEVETGEAPHSVGEAEEAEEAP